MDKDAQFKAVIETNQDRIYRVCCCYVRDENERLDVFQEVLVHIWRSLPDFQGRSQIGTWVYRVTVNTCLDHLRGANRRTRLVETRPADDPQVAAVAAAGSDPAMEDDVRHLHECIRLLPPIDRTVLSLYLEDMDTREMAEVLGISEGNVRVKLHRARQRLKAIWETDQHGS